MRLRRAADWVASQTEEFTVHVGAYLEKGAKQRHEVYRIQWYKQPNGDSYVAVSDMLDEGHFLQPTVQRWKVRTERQALHALRCLTQKYVKLLDKQFKGN